MSFNTEQFQNPPVIITTFNADFSVANEMTGFTEAARELLDQASTPQYYLLDFKRTFSMGDIMVGASGVARGEMAIFHHPNIKQVIFVTTDAALKLTASGMSSKFFGGLKIAVFSTRDTALDYARSN